MLFSEGEDMTMYSSSCSSIKPEDFDTRDEQITDLKAKLAIAVEALEAIGEGESIYNVEIARHALSRIRGEK